MRTLPTSAVEASQSIFQDLQQQAGVEGCFEVRQSRHGQGVFATRDLAKGEVGYIAPRRLPGMLLGMFLR